VTVDTNMDLKDIPRILKTDSLIYMENFVNDGSPSGFTGVTTLPKTYVSGESKNGFNISVLSVDPSQAETYGKPSDAFKHHQTGDSVEIPCYPFLLGDGSYEPLHCFPTSSSRTVLVNGKSPYFAKLHFPGNIGRAPRFVGPVEIRKSILISKLCDEAFKDKDLNDLSYLAEPFATYDPTKQIGCIYREFVPKPLIPEDGFLIPFFSLFSKDKFALDDECLLYQIEDIYPGVFMGQVVPQLIRSFFTLGLKYGLSFEQQAQNALLEVDENLKPRRIVLRDFLDCFVDNDIREREGLEKVFEQNCYSKESWGKERALGIHSFLFDFKVGNYILNPILTKLSEREKSEVGKLEQDVREIVKAEIQTANLEDRFKLFFPAGDRIYTYPASDNIWVDNMPNLIQTEKKKYR